MTVSQIENTKPPNHGENDFYHGVSVNISLC